MTESPFVPFSDLLQDVLRRNFIRRAATWLLGEKEDKVLAQAGNSAWEAAMTLLFLSRARALFVTRGEEQALCTTISCRSPSVTRWLLQRKQSDPAGLYNWEGVTWDTAVVVRCLLAMSHEYQESFTPTEKVELEDIVVSSTRWLCQRFASWETAIKYPFGPADVAQILITLIYEAEHHPDLYADAISQTPDTPTAIIDYLLHTKTTVALTSHQTDTKDNMPAACWWDDYFNTAEVLEALGAFYAFNARRSNVRAGLLETINETIVGSCTHFENTQFDAMWGSHIDTIRALQAYLALPRLVQRSVPGSGRPLLAPEPHTAFKALRWMCDEKQVFADGSMLHTVFLTVFYAHALIEAHESWEPASRRIDTIYDDVLWQTPVRTTPERLRRLAAEIRMGDLVRRIEKLDGNAQILASLLGHSRRTMRKLLFCVGVVAVSLPLGILVSEVFTFSELSIGKKVLKFTINDAGDFLTFATAWGGGIGLLLAFVWKFNEVFLSPRNADRYGDSDDN